MNHPRQDEVDVIRKWDDAKPDLIAEIEKEKITKPDWSEPKVPQPRPSP